MIRITSTALTFVLYGYANAAECGAALDTSQVYSVGDTVSALSPSWGELHNYQCAGASFGGTSYPNCQTSSVPFLFVEYLENGGPFPRTGSGDYGESWLDFGPCTSASPTATPTASPTAIGTASPTRTGCQPAYSAGATYTAGQQVSATTTIETPATTSCTCSDASCPSNPGQTTGCTKTTTVTTIETHNYQCVDSSDANWLFCSNAGYEPTGQYGDIAWVKLNAQCEGTVAMNPLAGITDPAGCPADFVAGANYEPEAKVSASIAGYSGSAKQIYICAAVPNNLFCGMSGFEPGTGHYWSLAWTEDTVCDGSLSPTASPSWDSAGQIDGCPGAWTKGTASYELGDRVSKNGVVFECGGSPHCSSEGFEPDVDSATEHWKMVWTVVGSCTGTISPTGAPTFNQADLIGCPDEWVKSTSYEEGDLVAVTVSTTPLRKIAFKCKAWPFSGFCGKFGPADFGGDQGWTKEGGCAGTISPTSTPSFDALALVSGCPDLYSAATTYEAGDQVAFQVAAGTAGSTAMADGWRFVVYECKDFPNSSFCSQEAYKPGSQYQNMAWTLKGHCDGTLSPTATPTAFNNADCPVASAYPECTYEAGLPTPATTIPQCKYNKAVEVTGIVCNCGDSGCPTPSPTSSSCTKTEIRNSCPAVDSWSSGVSYEAGDVVRIANYMYTCKAWPYYLWCSNAAYKPTTDPTDIWAQAWTAGGTCPSGC